jgi:trypsin
MVGKIATAVAIAAPLAAAFPSHMNAERAKQIIGGEEASAGQFPYTVSLQQSGSHFCGGVLIGPSTVVTAAHCSVGQSPGSVSVVAGSLTWASGGEELGVSTITVHPDYDESTIDNDVAVWALSSSVTESDTVGFVTLPSDGSDASGDLTVSGWGYTSEGGDLSDTLLYVTVPTVERSECADLYSPSPITDQMICAGVDAGGQDACSGDSGGPIVDESGALAGVVSWGNGCARAGYPGVYTRIGAFVSWIESNA